MPYSHIIPVLSLASGSNNDGALIGDVLETDFAAALTDVHIADTVSCYRKNVTGNSFSFEDISTAAGDDTVSDFLPFGITAQMTAGDKFYLACDHEKEELFFKIDTPGNWVGTMAIKYSSDGLTANAALQGVVDDTNGFRAAAGVVQARRRVLPVVLAVAVVLLLVQQHRLPAALEQWAKVMMAV